MAKYVRHSRLENGLDIYSQEDKNTHLLGIGIKSGYFSNPQKIPGLAHMVEHVVASKPNFKEYKKMERKFRELGCGPGKGIDIHTTMFNTFYGTDMLLRRKHSLELFDIFADMVKNTNPNLQVLESELAALNIEHFYHGVDNPDMIIFNLLHDLVYDKNPAKRGLVDDPEKLRNVRPREIRRFIEKHYVPNNMFAIILGPPEKDAIEITKKHFCMMEPKEVPPIDYDSSEPRPLLNGVRSILAKKAGLQIYHVGMAFPTVPFGHNKDDEMDVLSEVLEFRLEIALRRNNRIFNQGVYHPYVHISRSPHHGLLYMTFQTRSEDFMYEGIERIIAECEKIKHRGVDDEEIKRALDKLPERKRISARKKLILPYREEFNLDVHMGVSSKRIEYLEGFETTPGSLKEMIIDSACSEKNVNDKITGEKNHISWVNEYRKKLDSITPTKIVNTARKYLTTPDDFALAIIEPIRHDIEIVSGYFDDFKNRPRQQKLF